MPDALPLSFTRGEFNGRTVRLRTRHLIIMVNSDTDHPQDVETTIAHILNDANVAAPFQIVFKPLGRWAYIRFGDPAPDISQLVIDLKNHPLVRFAEPDLMMVGSAETPYPRDPLVQEGSDPYQWGIKYIHLDEVWKTHQGDDSVLIGLVDSGLPLRGTPADSPGQGNPLVVSTTEDDLVDHEDLDGTRFLAGLNYVRFDPPEAWPLDENLYHHGTHMAGIIAATVNNHDEEDEEKYVGTAGVNWGAKVYVCTALDSGNLSTVAHVRHAVAEILEFAADNGNIPVVINLSINQADDAELDTWIMMLESIRDADAILCNSAGNGSVEDGGTLIYQPAKKAVEISDVEPHVLVVGAIGRTEDDSAYLESESGRGIADMVFAPGEKVATTDKDNTYDWEDGTSIACAHVSALAALLWSTDPDRPATDIVESIEKTCFDPSATVKTTDAESIEISHGIVNALAAYEALKGFAECLTPSLVFDNVEPDLDHQQDIQIEVTSCGETTFTVETTGHDFGINPGTYSYDPWSETPFTLTATYAATTGDTASGTITIQWDQRPDYRWAIEITARRFAQRVSVYLVLDRSGSMASSSGIGSYSRLDVLKYSAGILVDHFPAGDGLGAVSFNSTAEDQADYRVIDPDDPEEAEANRAALKNDIEEMAAGGQTSIAAGISAAKVHLDALPPEDAKAVIVLTDGRETHEPWLEDLLAEDIGFPVFAIGMGNETAIQPDHLMDVTGATDGYTLLTGNLDDTTANLVAEFLSQILAEIVVDTVPTDPTQHIRPGAVHRFPVRLSEADKKVEALLLRSPGAPLDIQVFDPAGGRLPDGHQKVSESDRLIRVGFSGPPAHHGRGFSPEGIWQVEVTVPRDDFDAWIKDLAHQGVDTTGYRLHGPAYTFRVHSRSNLRMKCRIIQSGYRPGSTLTLRVALADRERPLVSLPLVTALLTDPWGGNRKLKLVRNANGYFETSVIADIPGIYRWKIMAEGRSRAGHSFRRDCKLTGAVWNATTPRPQAVAALPLPGGLPIGRGPA